MPGKRVISEHHVRDADSRGEQTLRIPEGAIITPLAVDTARERGITFASEIRPSTQQNTALRAPTSESPPTSIVIGSDHGGFALKEVLTKHLQVLGHTVRDVGTNTATACDYPDFAYAVARAVLEGHGAIGIMIDGAGIGSAMVCNKIPGIRAACAYNELTAWNARAHNNANVLTLGSRTIGDEVCKRIAETFLASSFEGGRHEGRVQKMTDIEQRFSMDR
jgi:ribose 5-phosphate isomerase B